jgi:ABC-type polysaccharide/polyol phosphate transport system ATPase subunit
MEILRVEDLNLVFRTEIHRPLTWRDAFIKAVQNPAAVFSGDTSRLHVLQGISFKLKRGDRVGILGVNGTGKTSLCRCISGIYRPSSGKISVQGKVRAVFDTAIGIFPDLSGRENAKLIAQLLYPEHARDHRKIIEEALRFSELGAFVDMPYRFYSNGMQARLCLSLVSSQPCDILILDEVFDGADVFFREKMASRILKLIEQSGAVLFVSHSAEQIHAACNRVLVLDRGKMIFDGEVSEGLRCYAKLRPRVEATAG